MPKGFAVCLVFFGGLVLGLAGCAGVQQKPAILEPGERTLVMKVESFKFEPNYIKARQGTTLEITLQNVASVEHNLTIKTPEGNKLVDKNIPAGGTASVKVELGKPGIYEFYCDRAFHSSMGMKGRIEVSTDR